jgi:hypothetical protein
MSVHDIDMNVAGSVLFNGTDLLLQMQKICGKY